MDDELTPDAAATDEEPQVAVSPEEALAADPADPADRPEPADRAGGDEHGEVATSGGVPLDDDETSDASPEGDGEATEGGTRADDGGGAVRPDLPAALEAVVMVADSPVAPGVLAQVVEAPVASVERALAALAEGYRAEGRGFELVQVAGGWRFQSHTDQAAYVERFVLEGQTAKLSAAALETLAIVAYKQPISRAQVAAIRGVSVDGVVRTLEQRGYIAEVARDPGPGQAVLFGTTPLFLDKLGLNSLSDLPAIADFVPGADVVEALEHGLRVESAEPADAGSPAPSPDRPSDLPGGPLAGSLEPHGPPGSGPTGPRAPGEDRPALDDLLDGDG